MSGCQDQELQVILEDIRNLLTVIKGVVQINSNKFNAEEKDMLISSVKKANDVIERAMVIIAQDNRT